jgi:putative transposase
MKKSRLSEEKIAMALRQAEAGTPVEEICRKLGVSEATDFRWKGKCGGLGVSEQTFYMWKKSSGTGVSEPR